MGRSNVRVIEYHVNGQYEINLLTGAQVAILSTDAPCDPAIGHWFVAVDVASDQTAGFAQLKVSALPGYGYLSRSGVYESHRGQGIQARLIRARERKARKLGLTHMVCDTSNNNHASSNSLIRCGYKLYEPKERWAFADGLYWIKRL